MNAAMSVNPGKIDDAHNSAVLDIEVAEIVVPENRARSLDAGWVEGLAKIIRAQGLTNAITVREENGKRVLVSGLHRLVAFKDLGRETIPARLSTASSDDEAKLEEVMENLGRNELNALDRCHHLYELKNVYEKLHPEVKNGGDRKSEKIRTQNIRSDLESTKVGKIKTQDLRFDPTNEIFAFGEAAAQATGLSRRAIEYAVAIWKGLSVASRRKLGGTWIAKHQGNLKMLSEQTPALQEKILDLMLAEPVQANSVSDALIIIQNGRLPDGQEKHFQALTNKLSRLNDVDLDIVLSAQADRVIAWAKKTGRI